MANIFSKSAYLNCLLHISLSEQFGFYFGKVNALIMRIRLKYINFSDALLIFRLLTDMTSQKTYSCMDYLLDSFQTEIANSH